MKAVEGKKRTWRRAAVEGAAAAIVAVLLGAASCNTNAPDIPSEDPLPCSSYLSWDGQWRDSDGEVIDEDPCDGVDSDHKKSPASKPKPVGTPQQNRPAPRTTRR